MHPFEELPEPGGRPVVHPLLLLALLGLVAALLFTNLAAVSLGRLGLPVPVVVLVLAGAAVGSAINIPLWRHRTVADGGLYRRGLLVFYRQPQTEEQILAINVGGAVLPIALSIWLLPRTPLPETALITVIITLLCYRLSRIETGVGITMPVFVPPIATALLTLFLVGTGPHAVATAYIAGSLGTLLGADIFHLGRISSVGSGLVAIGGAGVFDGVFLTGLVAVLLA